MSSTVYEDLKAAGVQLDNHETDLYAEATPQALEIVGKHGLVPTFFTDQVDGNLWFELPFRYDPAWPTTTVQVEGEE